MAERKILGVSLSIEERIHLAQLATQPGWPILVKILAEACRASTEEVIKLDPQTDRYSERIAALQMTARAINKFSADVLDSVRVHQQTALQEVQKSDPVNVAPESDLRFTGFKMPRPQSPTEGEK